MIDGNPFRHASGFRDVPHVETVDAKDRLEAVKSFNAAELRAVIDLPNVQKTVRVAAERRLRKLAKEAA